MQAHPFYAERRASVATIRRMFAWETEESFERLSEVVDRSAFARTAEGLELTDAERREDPRGCGGGHLLGAGGAPDSPLYDGALAEPCPFGPRGRRQTCRRV